MQVKLGASLIGIMWIGLLAAPASTAEPQAVIVPVGPDGVQRMEITVDSYSFTPNRLIVKENIPVELILKSISWIVPHNFVLKSPEAGLDIEQEIPAGGTVSVRFTPTGTGAFKFACTKRLLFFRSHEDHGMVGTLEVGK